MLLTPVCAVFVCVHSVQDVSSAMTECYSHQPVLYLCVGSQCTMYELSHDCMLLTPAYAVCVCVPSVWCMSSVMTERYSHQPLLCLCVLPVHEV